MASSHKRSFEGSLFGPEDGDDGDDDERLETQPATPQQNVPYEAASQMTPSAVHGRGMWNNFLRSFADPLYALLDLFDNAVDATWSLQGKSQGKPKIKVDLDTIGQKGIVIRNASGDPIPPMAQILEIFRSAKETNRQAIGENGVGIKHACANLSDLSIVLTQTEESFAIGILMKDLQKDAPCFPHVTFSKSADLSGGLESKCTKERDTWGEAIAMYGDGDQLEGIDRIQLHFNEMKNGADWKNSSDVFTIILTKLRQKGHSNKQDDLEMDGLYEIIDHEDEDDVGENSRHLLGQFEKKLPQLYIHINSIHVQVCGKSISMMYWEKRMAELTLFEVAVPQAPETDASLKLTHADPPYIHPTIRFWVGFDVCRPSGSAHLYYYSRQSGRLIKDMPDCRSFLSLSAGSTGFKQGLTIVVDDYNSTLPLNPTKQDLSFAFQEHGETHKTNLVFWMSGIATFFWNYHFELKGSSKLQLTSAVKLAGPLMEEAPLEKEVLPLDKIQCIRFPKIQWMQRKIKTHDKEGDEQFYCKLMVPKQGRKNANRIVGPNTLTQLSTVKQAAPTRRSRKRRATKPRKGALSIQKEDILEEDDGDSDSDDDETRKVRPPKRAAGKMIERKSTRILGPNPALMGDLENPLLEAKNKEIEQLKQEKSTLELQVARLEKAKKEVENNFHEDEPDCRYIHVRVINHETDRSADIHVNVSSKQKIRDVFKNDKVLRQKLFMWRGDTKNRLQKRLAVIKVGVWDPSKPKGDYNYVYDEEDLSAETTKQLYEYNQVDKAYDPICLCMFVEDVNNHDNSEEEFGLQDYYI